MFMRIDCLGSSSKANCWIVNNGKQALILDAGVSLKEINASGLIKSWRNVAGAFVTHLHNDHALALPELKRIGVSCYSPDNMPVGNKVTLGDFTVMAIPAWHSIDCIGFIIRENVSRKIIVYITDSMGIPPIAAATYDCVLMEVNTIAEIVEQQQENDTLHIGYEQHLRLRQVEEWLKERQIKPKTFVATHLSKENCDPKIVEQTLCGYCERFYIGKKGLSLVI